MTQNTDNGKSHAGKVAIGIAYENLRWISERKMKIIKLNRFKKYQID